MDAPVRLDKWLWAARFFKNRSLATDAVNGGRVHLNGQAVKPSKDVKPGDELEITIGEDRRTIVVHGTAERRGSATVARTLYEETPESVVERERRAEQRRLARPLGTDLGARPTKRDRRRFERTRRGR